LIFNLLSQAGTDRNPARIIRNLEKENPMKNARNTRLMAAASMLLTATAPSLFASNVLPSSDQPMGYSLANLAQTTAVYNTGVFSGSSATPAAPSIPFVVVEGDTSVAPNTYLYLPIFFADNSTPVDPAFPASVSNQSVDAAYLDNLVLSGFGVTAFFADVDGVDTTLDDSYITGVTTAPLLDASEDSSTGMTIPGTNYISTAAVISPLSIGDHTVGFGGIINGNPVTFGSSAVTVLPEPTTFGLLACAGTFLGRRRRHCR
jgi:hypothetical protein